MRFVIVGGGIAGVSAAQALKKESPASEVHILSEESLPLYYRPRLIDYLAGEVSLESLVVYPEDWYSAQGIHLHLGQKVTEIDVTAGRVLTATGERVPYDALLLATGARPFLPPIEGLQEGPPIYVLRTASDAQSLRKAAQEASGALVLGGGLLGLEAGRSLTKLGLSVTIVEAAPQLLPRQLDQEAAEILRRRLESMGLAFVLGRPVERVVAGEAPGGKGGGVAGGPVKRGITLFLQGGDAIAADVLLVASGVRSRVELAVAAGCTVERGVVVDDHLATTVAGLYAAGDVAQHRGVVYGIWPPAMEQGRAAGAAMAGHARPYRGSVKSHQLKVAGVDVVSVGEIDPRHELEEEVIADPASGVYRRLIKKDGRLQGAILVGDISGFRELQRQIEQEALA
ncbi:MAG: NAD(P)/FAD-dependent oxidoreductase [Firmicutes bacterium]|nr:NAD(P)/FAD-dependent oxidoreductase [Candidatus Fermentithermobacillaceae bacterium]